MSDVTGDLWEFISDSRLNRGLSHEELMEVRVRDQAERYTKAAQKESLEHAVKSGKEWSEADLEVLRMEHLTIKEQAKALGRTYNAVKSARIQYRRRGIL